MDMRSNRLLVFLLVLGFGLVVWPAVSAETGSAPAVIAERPDALSVDLIQENREKARGDKNLSDTDRKRLEEIFEHTLTNLRKAREWEQRQADLATMHASAPQILQALKADLEKVNGGPSLEIPEGTLLPDMEKVLGKAETDLKALKNLVADLEKQLFEMSNRRIEVPKALADAKQRRETLDQPEPDMGDQARVLQNPARWLRQSQQRLLDREIAAGETEIESFEDRLNVLKARKELWAKKTAAQETYVKGLQEKVNERRRREVDQAASQAQQTLEQAAGMYPSIQALAQENAEITAKRQELTGRLADISKSLDRQNKALKKVRDDFKNTQDRIKATGFTDSIGIMLRIKRNDLPDTTVFSTDSRRRKNIITRIQTEMLELDEKILTLADIETLREDLIRQLDPPPAENQVPFIRTTIAGLLKAQKEFLGAFSKDLAVFFNNLVDLDSVETQLLKVAGDYTNFIDERVLWIKSCQSFRTRDFRNALQGLIWFASPRQLGALATHFARGLWHNLFFWTTLAAGLAGIFLLRRRIAPQLEEIAESVPKAVSDRYVLTIKALFVTLIMATFRPLVLLTVSQVFLSGGELTEHVRAVSSSLLMLAPFWFFWEFLLSVFLPKGLADIHFNWRPKEVYEEIHTHLCRLIRWAFPILFLFQVFQIQTNEKFRDSIGRLLFVFGMFVLARLAHDLFYPPDSTFTQVFEFYRGKLVFRLRYVVYFLVAVFPVILVFAALAGYFYTAQRLLISSFQTLALFLGVLFLYALAFRALQVQRRTLALQKVQEKREEENEKPEEASDHADIGPKLGVTSHPEPNIHTMGQQIQRLLLSVAIIIILFGSWMIWRETLPAIRILDRVELWTTTIKVGQGVTSPDGTVQQQFFEQAVAITLMDAIIAIVLAALTVIGSRNIPGFIEFSLLQRLPLDAGVKYAIRTLTSYGITIVGVIAVFQVLGIGWEKVQWLAAGMSVGLGFGLQEIFANFVSGLILLFERPIRVGDIITVGDSSGTVAKIEIRATTVIDWDRKELIIPNREFITGKLMNWTLTDSVQRVVFKIGVAYGSDTDKVRDLLEEIARAHPKVMEDPAPKALFWQFGDSTLNFELRVFVPNFDNYPDFLHQINSAIANRFQAAGIEIPFPQRDLHLRTFPEHLLKKPDGGPTGSV